MLWLQMLLAGTDLTLSHYFGLIGPFFHGLILF